MTIKTISKTILICLTAMIKPIIGNAQKTYKTDTIPSNKGNIEITFIGHASLMLKYDGKILQIDPCSDYAEYSQFPKADLIILSHHHGDHMDMNAVQKISSENTMFVITSKCQTSFKDVKNVLVMKNGDSKEILGIKISAVPAYNIIHKRDKVNPYHPKGESNGYVLEMGGKKIYIAADTENIPEMKKLKNIDIAFLPMNLPYTMTPEMVADAAKMFYPKILYPYHFGETDTNKIIELLKNERQIEMRIRDMK